MNRHYQLEFRFLTKLEANCEFIDLALELLRSGLVTNFWKKFQGASYCAGNNTQAM